MSDAFISHDGLVLPELTNPASPSAVKDGYDYIDGSGNRQVGTLTGLSLSQCIITMNVTVYQNSRTLVVVVYTNSSGSSSLKTVSSNTTVTITTLQRTAISFFFKKRSK